MDYVGTEKNRTAGRRRCLRFVLCLITSLFIIMSGCSFMNSEKVNTPERQAKAISTQMIKCFKEKDSENLKSLFSQHVQEKYDLDTQIQEAFDFIDGDIVSHGEPDGQASGKSTDILGTEYEEIQGEGTSVKTDKGKSYGVYFFAYREYRYDKDYLGVYCIAVACEDEKNKDDMVFIGNIDETSV